jgi:RNA-directed DNA polymerase
MQKAPDQALEEELPKPDDGGTFNHSATSWIAHTSYDSEAHPVIRGWAEYHKHVVAKQTFSRIDCEVFALLWRWIRRRHPRKNAGWRKRKYYTRCGNRNWCFFADRKMADGSTNRYHLISVAGIPIRRHVKVRSAANPYDPSHRAYFAERKTKRAKGNGGKSPTRAAPQR